jgi:probable phosphoglycerate mutase
MHLYLIRHADPNYAIDGLTEQGHLEAQALARRLAGHGLQAIYVSTAGRALATAKYTADRLQLPAQAEAWLLEPGHLRLKQQGRDYMIWDTFGETVRAQLPPATVTDEAVLAMWAEFRRQVDGLIARHGYLREAGRYRIERSNRERIAIFCHNGTVLHLIAHFLEIPLPLAWCSFFAWPASVTTIYFEEQSARWAVPRALGIADVSHLYQAGLTPQPRGMGDRYEAYL